MATNCCDTEIDGVTAHGVILIDSVITGGTMTGTKIAKDCDNNDIFAGDKIVTCTKFNTEIGKKQDKLLRCNGDPMPGGQRIPTCSEVDSKISNATNGLLKTVAVKGEIKGNGTSSSPIRLEFEEDNAYENKSGVRVLNASLPMHLVGGNQYMLGRPAAWLKVTTKAGVMMVPAWNA